MRESTIIIDASILAKWFLLDEIDRENALRIEKDYRKGLIFIALPSLAYYEVNNLFKSAVSSQRISKKDAEDLYEKGFLALDFSVYFSNALLTKTLRKAVTENISAYDASYVALAQNLKIPFYTADEKLLQKAKAKYVKHVKHYISPLS